MSEVETSDAEDEFSPDVERLCALLQSLIEQNGSKKPRITRSWRQACDRMIRLDKRTPQQVENMIRWCQDDEFWRGNILSMPKLREKYDQLRLKALERREKPQPPKKVERSPLSAPKRDAKGREIW